MFDTSANEADTKAIRAGVKVMLDRRLTAYDDFVASVAKTIGILKAPKVVAFYNRNKIIKYDGSRYVVKHGAFWDKDVMNRAFDAACADRRYDNAKAV